MRLGPGLAQPGQLRPSTDAIEQSFERQLRFKTCLWGYPNLSAFADVRSA